MGHGGDDDEKNLCVEMCSSTKEVVIITALWAIIRLLRAGREGECAANGRRSFLGGSARCAREEEDDDWQAMGHGFIHHPDQLVS